MRGTRLCWVEIMELLEVSEDNYLLISVIVVHQGLSCQFEEAHSSKDYPCELQEMVYRDARTAVDHESRDFHSCDRFEE